MAKRAVRASLAGGTGRANAWEVERRELPFIALPRLHASHCACTLFVHFVSFSSCNNRSGNWHQRTRATCPRSHSGARGGIQSCLACKAVLTLLGHTALLGTRPSGDVQGVGPALPLPSCAPEAAAHAPVDSSFLPAGQEAPRPDKDLSVPSSPGLWGL